MIKCQFENGRESSLRHVTVGVIAVKNNQILLVKRSPKVINPGKYAIPGGFMDRDETAAQAALRELKEETGYSGKIKFILRVNDSPHRPQEDRQNVDFCFVAEISEKGNDFDKEEVEEVRWFNLNDLPPKDQFAFDHYENIQLYLQYIKNPSGFSLPIFNF